MTVITIGVVGIITVMLAVQMKGVKGEYATYLAAAGGCLIFFYGVGKLETILDAMRQIQEMVRINRVYLTTLLKITGITYSRICFGNLPGCWLWGNRKSN